MKKRWVYGVFLACISLAGVLLYIISALVMGGAAPPERWILDTPERLRALTGAKAPLFGGDPAALLLKGLWLLWLALWIAALFLFCRRLQRGNARPAHGARLEGRAAARMALRAEKDAQALMNARPAPLTRRLAQKAQIAAELLEAQSDFGRGPDAATPCENEIAEQLEQLDRLLRAGTDDAANEALRTVERICSLIQERAGLLIR